MIRILIAAIILTGCQAAWAQYLGSNENKTKNLRSSFTYESLKTLIADQKIKTIEDLIPRLPAPVRSNFTLMHRSRSLQAGTYKNPRAILFGEDARFILTYNGDSAQRGGQKLEIMQFRDNEAKFDFKEVVFEPNGVKFDENPSSCVLCHSASGKPIWDSYALWPGAFGSKDDDMDDLPERQKYEEFRAIAKTHPRYKDLLVAFDEKKYVTYANWQTPKDKKFLFAPYGGQIYKTEVRPNIRLSVALARLNAKRVARLITNSETFKKFPNISVVGARCWEDLKDYPSGGGWFWKEFAPQIDFKRGRYSLTEKPYVEIETPIVEGGKKYKMTRDSFEVSPYARGFPNRLRMIPFAGVSFSDWTVGLEKNGLSMFVGDYPLFRYIIDELESAFGKRKNCDDVEKLAVKELNDAQFPGFDSWFTSNLNLISVDKDVTPERLKQLVSNCAQCHQRDDDVAPYIPFGNPEELEELFMTSDLKQNIKNRLESMGIDRMPLNEFLSKKEIQKLSEYFDSL